MSKTFIQKTIRRETGLIENICKHGCGHPAYGSVDWLSKTVPESTKSTWSLHGCCQDRCCTQIGWKLEDLTAGVEIANDIILEHKKSIRKLESLEIKGDDA